MPNDSNTLRLHEIRRIFQKHYGAQSELARELTLSPKSISGWLKGNIVSARIAEAAQRKAQELSQKEAVHVA